MWEGRGGCVALRHTWGDSEVGSPFSKVLMEIYPERKFQKVSESYGEVGGLEAMMKKRWKERVLPTAHYFPE